MIGNDMRAASAFLFERQLRSFAPCQFLVAPTARSRNALQSIFTRRVYKHHRIALAIKANFKEKRRVDHKRRDAGRRLRKLRAAKRFNARMHDGFDTAAYIWSFKNGAGKQCAIDGSVVCLHA